MVAVTGASGFVGRRLVRELERCGHVVLAERLDVTDRAQLAAWAETAPSVVFHLAVDRDPARAHLTNVVGTTNVLAAASSASARVVHVGGALEADADNPYGATKAAATRLASEAGAVVVRPSFVYGPGQAEDKFIPTVLRAARHGGIVPLLPAAPVDWVHVDDVVAACLAAAAESVPSGTVVDVVRGQQRTPDGVVADAEAALHCTIRTRRSAAPRRAWDQTRPTVDPAPLQTILGVRARSLRDGLRDTWEAAK